MLDSASAALSTFVSEVSEIVGQHPYLMAFIAVAVVLLVFRRRR
jgi:hypothetical protein